MKHVIDDYWVYKDDYCIVLCEKDIVPEVNKRTGKPNKNAGKEVFTNYRYFPTLEMAVSRLIEDGYEFNLMNKDIRHAINFVNKAKQWISEHAKELKEIQVAL